MSVMCHVMPMMMMVVVVVVILSVMLVLMHLVLQLVRSLGCTGCLRKGDCREGGQQRSDE